MDSPSSAAGPDRPTGRPTASRDRVIAAALRRLNRHVDFSTCTAYLLTEDDRALAAAMMVDTTMSFTVPSGMAADQPGGRVRARTADRRRARRRLGKLARGARQDHLVRDRHSG
ncbi:hypothetical protein ACWD6R_21395 [Streptomyces sp. NPDC005151]